MRVGKAIETGRAGRDEVECKDEGREKEAESIRLIKSSRSSNEVQRQQVSLTCSANSPPPVRLVLFSALPIARSLGSAPPSNALLTACTGVLTQIVGGCRPFSSGHGGARKLELKEEVARAHTAVVDRLKR